jgi:hypothetical protein
MGDSARKGAGMDDSEVERLQARVAELEAQLDARQAPTTASEPGRRSPWWAISAGALIVLACILAPLSVASTWASTQISSTDQYVQTVAPLIDDPEVQSAISTEVTNAVFEGLDIEGLTEDALTAIAEQPNVPPRVAESLPTLAAPLTNGVRGFVQSQVEDFVASPQFAQLWAEVNRVAHEQVVILLEGRQGGAISAQDDTVTLNLGPIVERVKQRLVDGGFTLAASVPAVDRSFVLVQSDAVTNAQGFYRLVNAMGAWLPIVVVALLVAGVLLAADKRRALVRGALGVAAAMVVLGVGLSLARMWYLSARPGTVLSDEGAGSVYDTLVAFLRTGLRAAAVLALLVALGAFLAGPSGVAVRIRSWFQRWVGALRGEAEEAGWQTGPVGPWVGAHRRAVQAAVLVAAGLTIMFWTRPTALVVLVTALVVVLALVAVEFLAHPAPTTTGSSAPALAASDLDLDRHQEPRTALQSPQRNATQGSTQGKEIP